MSFRRVKLSCEPFIQAPRRGAGMEPAGVPGLSEAEGSER